MTNEPRAYTADEARDMIINQIRNIARYWATLPDYDEATRTTKTIQNRCEGVAFSILALLDGCQPGFPPVTLTFDPHPEDKEFRRSEGESWFEPGMEISDMLHEYFYKKDRPE